MKRAVISSPNLSYSREHPHISTRLKSSGYFLFSHMGKRTAIMGFGNPVRSDDAIGIYVIEKLRKEIEDQSHVSLLDMGTSAFEVLFKLKGHERIILVDAVVNTGEAVGTLYKVPAEEIRRAPVDDPMVFLHSIKWDQALSYAKKILQHEYPEDIMVYLIAVDNTQLEIELSEAAQQAGDKVVTLIKEELAK
jgi:hydrogenase maturation protease